MNNTKNIINAGSFQKQNKFYMSSLFYFHILVVENLNLQMPEFELIYVLDLKDNHNAFTVGFM